jgi:hypothetical protein
MIYVISTSANIAENYESRKQDYLTGLASVIEHYRINPFIIEANRSDYLSEHFRDSTRYSENKGVNECILIELFFQANAGRFHDHDDIIKTTLRYKITSSALLDHVKQNTHEIYGKRPVEIYGPGTTLSCGLISMKYRLWREFYGFFNKNLGRDDPIENEFDRFARSKNLKLVEQLGITMAPYMHDGKKYEV